MDQPRFDRENSKRIKAVERSFGASTKSLSRPGRFLVGQGCLKKQGRRKSQTKVFFLFNDVLVYGSIVLFGRLHKKLTVIPLDKVLLEDMEDTAVLKNQWLIRTPRKSFFVSAQSQEEKEAWIEHINLCQEDLLQVGSLQNSTFASTWIPDKVSHKCLRCFSVFSATKRRHHCRKCGLLVCNSCSKKRMMIEHIHATKKLRVCKLCHTQSEEDETARCRGDSAGKNNVEDEDTASSDEEEEEEEEEEEDGMYECFAESGWLQAL
ncbi:pleckstrin homology domain-containing family F member 1-like [Brachionichthys hirsutus]|uniref:pleckstrin homology domain-containing family F member 1-like n=1 Tax=Brachionichthys hirsutus TaxID=412623 RepID=UPI003604AB6F